MQCGVVKKQMHLLKDMVEKLSIKILYYSEHCNLMLLFLTAIRFLPTEGQYSVLICRGTSDYADNEVVIPDYMKKGKKCHFDLFVTSLGPKHAILSLSSSWFSQV